MLTFSITGGRCKTFAILFLVYSCMFEILQTWKKEGKFPGHFAHICMSSNGYGTVFSIFIFSPKETSQDSPSLYVNELLVNGFFLVAEYHPEGHFPSQLFWVLLTSCLRVTDFISLVQSTRPPGHLFSVPRLEGSPLFRRASCQMPGCPSAGGKAQGVTHFLSSFFTFPK